MIYNDDETIDSSQFSGSRPPPIVEGRVQLTCINNNTTSLEASKLKALLELTGGDSINDRPGLDLVAVLDVSGSMEEENKIGKMKTAMLFVIKKLSPIDRLSLVKFFGRAERLCPLRQVTENSQRDLEQFIQDLKPGGKTNTEAGLRTGLKVLNDRRFSGGRVVAIMLMSDGKQTVGDATQVQVGNVPVHTFSFGTNYYPQVLKCIADNSLEGTFSDVQNTSNLSLAFSQCLAGLLTVVVQDLKLTVTRIKGESTIQKVSAGSYPQSIDSAAGSVTVTFGNLYSKEVRKIIVELLLPSIEEERGAIVLEITYSYRTGESLLDAPPVTLTVSRSRTNTDQQERPEVMNEETRTQIARMMKEARIMADGRKLEDAQNTLRTAQNSLKDGVHESHPLVETLRTELLLLLNLMASKEIYERQGRPFALSSETSHERQRFAARGDVVSLRLFATPRMEKYLEQAKLFDENPSKPPPSEEEDVEEELTANPPAPIAGPDDAFYIQAVIQSLQVIVEIFNRGLNYLAIFILRLLGLQ